MKKLTILAMVGIFALGTVTTAFGENKDSERLISALTAENLGWRVDAAKLLGESGDMDAVKPFIKALRMDREDAVRITAAVALAKIGDSKALKALKKASKTDSSLTVRRVARGAFYELKKTTEALASKYINPEYFWSTRPYFRASCFFIYTRRLTTHGFTKTRKMLQLKWY